MKTRAKKKKAEQSIVKQIEKLIPKIEALEINFHVKKSIISKMIYCKDELLCEIFN